MQCNLHRILVRAGLFNMCRAAGSPVVSALKGGYRFYFWHIHNRCSNRTNNNSSQVQKVSIATEVCLRAERVGSTEGAGRNNDIRDSHDMLVLCMLQWSYYYPLRSFHQYRVYLSLSSSPPSLPRPIQCGMHEVDEDCEAIEVRPFTHTPTHLPQHTYHNNIASLMPIISVFYSLLVCQEY